MLRLLRVAAITISVLLVTSGVLSAGYHQQTPWGVEQVQFYFEMEQDKHTNAIGVSYQLWQKEEQIHVMGWEVYIDKYVNLDGIRDSDNPNHAVDFDADGGNVGNGEIVKTHGDFHLSGGNTIRIRDVDWIGAKGDRAKASPDFGWTIQHPTEGRGGNFIHRITIYNDDATESFTLSDIKFKPDWSFIVLDETSVPLIDFDTVITGEYTLAPGDSFYYDLGTATEMIHGHIYGQFVIDDGLVKHVFDHEIPVIPVPSLTEWGLLVLVALLIASAGYIIYKRRRAVAVR